MIGCPAVEPPGGREWRNADYVDGLLVESTERYRRLYIFFFQIGEQNESNCYSAGIQVRKPRWQDF